MRAQVLTDADNRRRRRRGGARSQEGTGNAGGIVDEEARQEGGGSCSVPRRHLSSYFGRPLSLPLTDFVLEPSPALSLAAQTRHFHLQQYSRRPAAHSFPKDSRTPGDPSRTPGGKTCEPLTYEESGSQNRKFSSYHGTSGGAVMVTG